MGKRRVDQPVGNHVGAHVDQPEFHIVVRRPGRGPIAPYRLVIVVAFTILIGGDQLWTAAQTGVDVDSALVRCLLAGTFAWLVLGWTNSILKTASPPRPAPADVDVTERAA